MARIRSIKPEFWTDEKVSRLPGDTALFFIGLWTHADDHGFFLSSSSALALLLPRYRPQVIQPMLSRLEIEGLVRVSRGAGVGLIVGWHHQKIKDRRASKWAEKEITWDEPKTNAATLPKRRTRIGEDRSGEDRSGILAVSGTPIGEPASPKSEIVAVTPIGVRGRGPRGGKHKPVAPTTPVWESYREAYLARYKIEPLRNDEFNFAAANLIRKVGAADAPAIAAFYVQHDTQYYVQRSHPLTLAVPDAQKLRTEWLTGNRVTSGKARQVEQKANVIDVWGPLIAEAERKEREGA